MRRTETELNLTVSNPLNQQLDVVVGISRPLAGDGVEVVGEDSQVRVALPGGMYAGQSVSRALQVLR